jgi:transcription termination/antitermination protein NusG
MSRIPDPHHQWYVVHVLSGKEQQVYKRILRNIEAEEMGDRVFEVILPTELVSEVRSGKKLERKKKFYPGYIIVNMELLRLDGSLVEDSWYFIKDTDGVIGFAGTKDKPIPMRQRDVEAMLNQIKEREQGSRPAVRFRVGDAIKVIDGPFQSQDGIVEEIDEERGKLHVSVSIFGRETPVELEFWQVERGE